MAYLEPRLFKYPSEDECLVRRLGIGLMSVWPSLPPDTRERILAEANIAWDREYYVSRLPDRLEGILSRFNIRPVTRN